MDAKTLMSIINKLVNKRNRQAEALKLTDYELAVYQNMLDELRHEHDKPADAGSKAPRKP